MSGGVRQGLLDSDLMSKKKSTQIGKLHLAIGRDLKSAIANDAAERGTNLNQRTCEILALYFGIEFEPKQMPSPGIGDSDVTMLRMPQKLKDKIFSEAYRRRSNQTAIVLTILSDYYDIPYTSRSNRSYPGGGGTGRTRSVAAE